MMAYCRHQPEGGYLPVELAVISATAASVAGNSFERCKEQAGSFDVDAAIPIACGARSAGSEERRDNFSRPVASRTANIVKIPGTLAGGASDTHVEIGLAIADPTPAFGARADAFIQTAFTGGAGVCHRTHKPQWLDGHSYRNPGSIRQICARQPTMPGSRVTTSACCTCCVSSAATTSGASPSA
jgi:hypothetical protein